MHGHRNPFDCRNSHSAARVYISRTICLSAYAYPRRPRGDPCPCLVPPLIPTLVEEPPAADGWVHEIEHNGGKC
jgi:hypothetical protein